MTTLLCIDTATPQCGISLLHNNEVYAQTELASGAHSNVILFMIDKVCSQSGVKLAQVDAIGVTVGPGSFIGVRTGVCVAQSIAFVHDIPIVGLSVLAVLAQTGFDAYDVERVISGWDARMKSLYWGGYILQDGLAVCSIPDRLSCVDSLQQLPWPDAFLVGNPWQTYGLVHKFSRVFSHDLYPSPYSMLKLVARKYRQGDGVAAHLLEPLYLRNDIARPKSS